MNPRTPSPLSTATAIAVTAFIVITGVAYGLANPNHVQSPATASPPTSLIYDNGHLRLPETGLSSQIDTTYPFSSQVADDFRLTQPAAISQIHFWGVAWQDTNIQAGSFHILFYNTDTTGTRPTGTGMQDPTTTAIVAYNIPQADGTQVAPHAYEYNASLEFPFNAQANTTYWLVIQYIGQFAQNGQWGWATTDTTGDTAAPVQGCPYTGTPYWTNMHGNDQAFQLIGQPLQDTEPPYTTCSLNGTMNGTIYTSDVTVTLSAIDNSSGVNYTMVNVDNSSYTLYSSPVIVTGDGTHTIQYYSVDNEGNQETAKNTSFTIQTTAPDTQPPDTLCLLNGTLNGSIYISDVTVTLLATDNGSGVNSTQVSLDNATYTLYTTPFLVTGNGTHTVRYYSVDNAGNQEPAKNSSFTINITTQDLEPPLTTCTLNGTTNGSIYTSNVTVTLTAIDNSSGVNYTMVKVDNTSYTLYTAPFLVTGNGNHTVSYYSVDVAGDQEPEKHTSFAIQFPPSDTEPPVTTCSLNGTTNGSIYTSNVTVTLTAIDNSSGVNYTMINVDNTSYTLYTSPVIVTGDGTHTIQYYSVDNAGNQEADKNTSFTIQLPPADTEPPVTTCSLNGTMNGTIYVSDVTATLTATDTGSGVDYTMAKVDTQPYTIYTKPLLISGIGNHTLWFYSVDHAGNQETEKNVSFTIMDLQPPTTSIILNGTLDGTTYTSNVTVLLNATDNYAGVNYTMIKIDNQNYTRYTAPRLVTGNGTHTIRYYSVDKAGNQEPEKNASFTIALGTIRLSMNVVLGLGVHAYIKNSGTKDAIAVHWNITAPGMFIFFGNHTQGTIDIPAGQEVLVKDFIIGIGRPVITVTAGPLTKTVNATVLFFVVINRG